MRICYDARLFDRSDPDRKEYAAPQDARRDTGDSNRRIPNRYGGSRGAVGGPDVFDRAGTAALRDAEKADLVVMDEIGFLEADAAEFRARIGKLLDGDTPILGVVRQQGEAELQQTVRGIRTFG